MSGGHPLPHPSFSADPKPSYFRVAVDAPIGEPLTYAGNSSRHKPGQFVEVPLGRRAVGGVILYEENVNQLTLDPNKIKSILEKDLPYPFLSEKFLKWLKWISEYYHHPLGQVAQLALPPLEKKRGRESNRNPVVPSAVQKASPPLTEGQTKIVSSFEGLDGFSTHLIFGVTGSGKTEVYMNLIEKALLQGKKALFLVPEIALTPQLSRRFAERFGDHVAVLHSQLTDRERTDQWWDIVEGRRQILVGARSALFCPVDNVGVIVVDEEHEASYKQDEKLKYNGRDCAVMLGKIFEIPVILGSATPSLETWKNAKEGRYHFHELGQRVFQQSFPQISIVDMKKEKDNPSGLPPWLSGALHEKLQSTLDQGLQSALLLNRRGLAQVVMCKSCGHTSKCPNCEISLTLHYQTNLVCHYCDYQERLTESCPQSHEGTLEP
jgi:primosomal protein N' (replication factor Y)